MRQPIRYSLKKLLLLFVLVAIPLGYCRYIIILSQREYAAYEELCDLGAIGDDWVSFKEALTGRPPIVQMDIPANVDLEKAISLLPPLNNLEGLSLAADSLSDAQLRILAKLGLNSLVFRGAFPRDQDVERLNGFYSLKFLYLPKGQLSRESINRLRSLLPRTKIEAR